MGFGVHVRAGAVQSGVTVESDGIGRAQQVLLALFKAAGRPKFTDLEAQAAKSNLPCFSRSTYYDLLNGKRRSVTAVDFIRLCVEYARTHPKIAQLTPDKFDVRHWQDKYENALKVPAPVLEQRVGLPPPQVASFVPRAVLDESPVHVLTGLGGVGKTQIAAAHAWDRWHDPTVDLIIWVSAKERRDIESTYAQAARQMLGADLRDTAQAVRQLMSWLSTNRRWLIVLDDVAFAGHLRELLPPATGRTVITTRHVGAAWDRPWTRVVPVDVFTKAEARAYLSARLGQESDELAADLGHLPLALSHAAAYIRNTQMSVVEYRSLFADRKRRVADLMPVGAESPDEHTVATTWSLSVQRAETIAPVRPLLEIAAVLDPNGIPLQVFTSGAVTRLHGDDTRQTLSLLHRFSLLTFDPSSPARAVTMHALVQRVTREDMSTVNTVAADALAELRPRDRELAVVLFDNTRALLDSGPDSLWHTDAHPLLEHAGSSLGLQGLVHPAAEYFGGLAAIAAERLGPDHPTTLTFRHEVAFWTGLAGDPAGAIGAMRRLLADRLRVLGTEHPRRCTPGTTWLVSKAWPGMRWARPRHSAGCWPTRFACLVQSIRTHWSRGPTGRISWASRETWLVRWPSSSVYFRRGCE